MRRYKTSVHHQQRNGCRTKAEVYNSQRKKRNIRRKRLIAVSLIIFLTALFFTYGFVRYQTADSVKKTSSLNREIKADNRKINKKESSRWNLLLVNSEHPLKEHDIKLTHLKNGQAVDARIYPELQEMMDAMRAEGLSPLICSSYRTMEKQEALYNEKVRTCLAEGFSQAEAEKEAATWVAPPGTSEHQLGLALDIVASYYQLLDESQEDTPEQKWLMEHCAEYGFILRYPTDKSDITGIGYEPWHYRYVGKDAAKEIMEKGICLEEYLK